MAISAGRLLFGNRLMVSARVIALAVHFTMARDAAAQAVMGQPIPLMDRQREIALALSSCPSTLAEKACNEELLPHREADLRATVRTPSQSLNRYESGVLPASSHCFWLPTDKCPAPFFSNV
jgi:hypothetical protein